MSFSNEQRSHSILTQRIITSPSNAHHHFSTNNTITNDIPLVLIPRSSSSISTPFQYRLTLPPPGPYTILWQQWHRHKGSLPLAPSSRTLMHKTLYFWPFYKRISHIVLTSIVRYVAPTIFNVTTRRVGRVTLNVRCVIDFQIGPGVDDVTTFVYRLGAGRLDDILRAECEGCIRGLIYERVDATMAESFWGDGEESESLRTTCGEMVKELLALKVREYGVVIWKVILMNGDEEIETLCNGVSCDGKVQQMKKWDRVEEDKMAAAQWRILEDMGRFTANATSATKTAIMKGVVMTQRMLHKSLRHGSHFHSEKSLSSSYTIEHPYTLSSSECQVSPSSEYNHVPPSRKGCYSPPTPSSDDKNHCDAEETRNHKRPIHGTSVLGTLA